MTSTAIAIRPTWVSFNSMAGTLILVSALAQLQTGVSYGLLVLSLLVICAGVLGRRRMLAGDFVWERRWANISAWLIVAAVVAQSANLVLAKR
jgi:hypothetical protein